MRLATVIPPPESPLAKKGAGPQHLSRRGECTPPFPREVGSPRQQDDTANNGTLDTG